MYKFDFCVLCPLYECELVEGYIPPKNTSKGNTVVLSEIEDIRNDVKSKDSSGKSIVTAVAVKENVEKIDLDIGYIQNDLKNGCVVAKLMRKECDRQRVADGIGGDYEINVYDFNQEVESDSDDWKSIKPGKWEPKQPVYISAQTGQGKNYFIENTLLPYLRELNYKNHTDQRVLIISNRIAPRMQIKNRLKQGKLVQANDQDDEFFANYKGYPTDIISYQSLLKKIDYLEYKQKQKISRYIFVVCDEAHFFTSDAMFNPYTEKILRAIVNIFKDAIRIYMTATPYECLPYIENMEKDWKTNRKKETSVFYHHKRDYRYLNIKYYSKFKELYDLIIESCKKKEKWLIFIDNKKECEKVKMRLAEYWEKNDTLMKSKNKDNASKMDKVITVEANSKDAENYQDMVLDEELNKDTYVLISTSVLDNGVNLRGIKNIVVSDMSKVKCLQMVGRARVEGDDDTKTLYLKRFNTAYVEKRLSNLEEQKKAYHSYDLAYDRAYDDSDKKRKDNSEWKFLDKYNNGEYQDWKNAKHWFGRDRDDPKQVYPNEIARSLVNESIEMYEFILQEMRRNDVGQKVTGQKYLEYQLSWFGKKYDVENDITLADKDAKKNEFISFLESYKDRQLFEDEQDQFSIKFTELYDKAFTREKKNKDRIYGIKTIKALLNDLCLGYKAINEPGETPDGKNKTYWMVVKLDLKQQETDIVDQKDGEMEHNGTEQV